MQRPLGENTCCLICSLTSSIIRGQPVIPETLSCSAVMSWQRSKEKKKNNQKALPAFILLPKCITLLFLQVANACLTGGDWDNYDEARQSPMFPFLNGNCCYLSPKCGPLFLLWVRLTLFYKKLFPEPSCLSATTLHRLYPRITFSYGRICC